MAAKPIPEGQHSITPYLAINDAAKAIEFYKKAFSAEELGGRAPDPSGKKIWHAEIKIGDSVIFINDAFPDMGGNAHPSNLWIYSEKADELFQRAVDAGAKVLMPMQDQFWGDRTGTLVDKWGNRWSLAKHIRDMTPEDQKKAAEAFIASTKK